MQAAKPRTHRSGEWKERGSASACKEGSSHARVPEDHIETERRIEPPCSEHSRPIMASSS